MVSRRQARGARASRLDCRRGQCTAPDRSRPSSVQAGYREIPEWSPDGTAILFSSKQQKDPDRTDNWDLFVIAPTPGAGAHQLTRSDLDDSDPQWESRAMWSPDSREIAFLQGGPDSLIYFSLQRLAVISAAGGTVRVVSRSLDRSFVHPAWSADGKWIYAHWGEKDFEDVLAGVDFLATHPNTPQRIDLAQPVDGRDRAVRLGVGGWSYGGELTDYVIASRTRSCTPIAS